MCLFHGTSEESIKQIARFGFNRSLCGKNGTAYGQGVYFAVNSSYSDGYAGRTQGNFKIMFRVRVLVGDSCVGNSQMKEPPKKNTGEPFDSTTDGSKQIFVCYHDNQCYPEYIITYN